MHDRAHGPARSYAPSTLGRRDGEERDLASLRVVVVDDNDGFRESLIALLGSGGLKVVGEASSGPAALDRVAELAPDIVLMDIRMPGMDGVETTRRLKAAHPNVRVMALTAQEDETVVREMLVAGASGYVLKNSEGDEILAAISEAAGGGAVLSPAVTPTVIDQLTDALDRERQRSKELEEAHLSLIERVARRNELVSRLGHELRTPVTVILGLAKTLGSEGIDPAEQAELLGRLDARAQALARLVERFETALDATSGEVIDVSVLAREVAAGDSRVVVHAEPAVPNAWGNPMLARRVLEEIVDNACRFSASQEAVQVRIEGGPGVLEVRVIDRGPGIRPEDRERIFEPLEQGEALDSRTHEGAGVGLSVGRAAARAMDGDLVLEATGSDGSTFLWTLPIADSHRQ
jgi:signal transduction histidine kinase